MSAIYIYNIYVIIQYIYIHRYNYDIWKLSSTVTYIFTVDIC